ncbi:YIP1 family protein [Shouchella lonarensis]|uniref:Yip1 domain-containing protein n=1 Tax=Shouchella lonarensis TaxID=1464122 RepID=A0A1G6HMW8_9BACI|nr:YIP1 family protein [Shouchella lonarensis]SDB95609.1 Yip1 domain-containing protein [Shouchella lonarensis]
MNKNWDSWWRVWVSPRLVTRQELAKADSRDRAIAVILLATLGMMVNYIVPRVDSMTFEAEIGRAFVGGLVSGPATLYLYPKALKWVGSWLGGKGRERDLGLAFINGYCKPAIVTGVIFIPIMLIAGVNELISMLLGGLYYLVILPWIIVIHLHTIAVAHKFSVWKALGALAIVMTPLFILLFVFIFFLNTMY